MNYQIFLRDLKSQLQTQLNIKKALIIKYDIDGYISHKRIGQKVYDYLQYRDRNGEIVSVYLSEEDKDIYLKALAQREIIQQRIARLSQDIEMLSGVPTEENVEGKVRLPEKYAGFRMLHGSVGVSPRFHAMFHIEAMENKHEYRAVATYRKRKFSAPLVYVPELNISDIPIYMSDAAMVIDNAISDAGIQIKEKSKDVLKGKTREGIAYKASRQKSGYIVNFTYHGQHCEFMIDMDYPDITDDMRRFSFSSRIKEYIRKIDMDDALRRYYGK